MYDSFAQWLVKASDFKMYSHKACTAMSGDTSNWWSSSCNEFLT